MKHSISYMLLLTFLFIQTGCWSSEAAITNPYELEDEEYITLLFSNDSSLNYESSFYDALLELRKQYPEHEIPFDIINSENRDIIRYYNITEYPTLIILEGSSIVLRIEGKRDKEVIKTKLYEIIIPEA
ncbi:hypothetical protein [Bacillus alkalicellulosilyticus]|uniref:hypothetical protein n=1 Tax=Alkalihalobacterium alkalicellulosilyticum TaxID=1912214 RepID=UPI000995F077|nr:hypothetical protein [Bacillus alkalicellulosilyticus]